MLFFLLTINCYIINTEFFRKQSAITLHAIGNSIITGNFTQLEPSRSGPVTVKISSSKSNSIYFESSLKLSEPSRFSFNLKNEEVLLINVFSEEDLNIRFGYETQFDTFNNEVANNVVLRPAIKTLNGLKDLLSKVNRQTYEKSAKIQKLDNDYKKSMVMVLILSVSTAVGFAVINFLQVVWLKKFFKQKKLI